MKRDPLVLTLVLLPMLAASLAAGEPAGDVPDATRAVVLQTIEDYVQQDIARKGKFLVLDPRSGKPLALTFDHVHQGVKPTGDAYLACVDFASADGTVHDVDVVVDVSGDQPRVTKVFLHKVGGEKVATAPQ